MKLDFIIWFYVKTLIIQQTGITENFLLKEKRFASVNKICILNNALKFMLLEIFLQNKLGPRTEKY